MSSAFFDPIVGGDGSTVSDDASPTTGLANGGHRTRFVPALAQVVAVARNVLANADAARAAAASALGGIGSLATSITLVTIGAGDKVFDVGSGKTFGPGQKVGAARSSNPTVSAMYGTVKSYSGSTLTLEIEAGNFIDGGNSYSDWTISPSLYGPSAARSITGSGLVTGGGNLSADRVLTVSAAADTDVWAASANDKATTPKSTGDAMKIKTLAYGATVTWNHNDGHQRYLTMAGNPVMANPTNLKDGWTYVLFTDQGPAGNRTFSSWGTTFDFGSAGEPTLSTGANKVDILTFIYSATTGKMHFMGIRLAA